jgi:hypothetical protein
MHESSSDPLAFDPVPSRTNRHDGWTPEKQRAFIQALSRIGVLTMAARSVGMSAKSAYALLKRAGEESSFARAWREALVQGRTNVRYTSIGRALDGELVPYFYGGLQRGYRRVFNDRLLIAAFHAIQREEARERGEFWDE